MDSPAFYVLLFIHLIGLILGFGSTLVTDLYGALWLRDRERFPHIVRVSGHTETFIWAGWCLTVAAGIPLLVIKAEIDNLLLVKLFFVALVGANGVLLRRIQQRLAGYAEGDDVPAVVMFRAAFCLFVSQLGWWGAVSIGFAHRHIQTVIDWPPMPWLVMAAILFALAAIWAGGERAIRRNEETAERVKDRITPG